MATACRICSWPSRKAARFPSISSSRTARWPRRKTFPTLAGVSDLAVADWDGDGKPEIFMLSADERQVGVTRLDEKQRLPFPTLIPLDGKPLAMAVGDR